MRPHHLKITQHDSHAEIDVLEPCGISWSTNSTLWHDVLSEVPAGTKYRDFDGPRSNPRSYASIIDGRLSLHYYHREAALAFAEAMAPWIGGDEEKPRKKKKKIKSSSEATQ